MINIYSTRLFSRYKNLSDEEMIMLEIEETKREIRKAYQDLSRTTDSLLTESVVYRLKGLEIKYGYLLRKLKEKAK